MTYYIALCSGDSFVGSTVVARSAQPQLVGVVVAALRDNRLHEDDGMDVLYETDFLVTAARILAETAGEIRRQAAGACPGEMDAAD